MTAVVVGSIVLGDCNNNRSFDYLTSTTLLFAVLKFLFNASKALGSNNGIIYAS